LGYQQGIIEYARNPTDSKEALLDYVLASNGCRDKSGVSSSRDIVSSRMFSKANRAVRKVARIGGKIMIAAKALAAQKQAEAIEAVLSTLQTDISKENLVAILDEDDSYQRWTTAVEQLDGKWTYMLIDSQVPNAFVHQIMPRHIFITTSMLNIIGNEDELALVLGHELSHMLLGHNSEKNMVETMLRTIEVLLLSMDPTSGVLSLLFVGSLATLRTAFTAAHSREDEHEADELGIQLAAMACFDTRKAASMFRNLDEKAGVPNGTRLLSFADTHPSSSDRYEKLILASTTENADKYATTSCSSVKSRLRSVMNTSGGSSNR
jgi:predicted Zn-dependent protease